MVPLRKYIRSLLLESLVQETNLEKDGTSSFRHLVNKGYFSNEGTIADYNRGFDDFYSGRRVAVFITPPNPYHLNPHKPNLVEKWVKDANNLQVWDGYQSYDDLGSSGNIGPADPTNKQYMKGWTTAGFVSGHDFDGHEGFDNYGSYKKPSSRIFKSWKKSIWKKNGKPVMPIHHFPTNPDGSGNNPLFGKPNAEYGVVRTAHLGIKDYHDYWLNKKGIPIEDHPVLSSFGFVTA